MDAKILEVWQCDKCDTIYKRQDFAEKCCKEINTKNCSDCGKQLPKEYYSYVCDECKEKRIFDNTRQMTYSEYVKEFPDHIISDGDRYWDDIEDFEEYIEEMIQWHGEYDKPKYLFGTTKIYSHVDAQYALECSVDGMGEEYGDYDNAYYDDEIKKFIDFVEEWNDNNKVYVFAVDKQIAIVL